MSYGSLIGQTIPQNDSPTNSGFELIVNQELRTISFVNTTGSFNLLTDAVDTSKYSLIFGRIVLGTFNPIRTFLGADSFVISPDSILPSSEKYIGDILWGYATYDTDTIPTFAGQFCYRIGFSENEVGNITLRNFSKEDYFTSINYSVILWGVPKLDA